MTTALEKGNSVRAVSSNQPSLHQKLEATVRKHLQSHFQKPLTPHSKEAFEQARQWLQLLNRPFILDSFCGTGESTHWLATQHPEHAVIGVDKSAVRLTRHQSQRRDNYLLLRSDTDDFWRLLVEAGIRPDKHCIFYPNPWPKSEHLKRRCHGSPLFPSLLALGGELELRTNWLIYAEEFCTALGVANINAQVTEFSANPPVTAFERKYSEAGQSLWRLHCELPSTPPAPL